MFIDRGRARAVELGVPLAAETFTYRRRPTAPARSLLGVRDVQYRGELFPGAQIMGSRVYCHVDS